MYIRRGFPLPSIFKQYNQFEPPFNLSIDYKPGVPPRPKLNQKPYIFFL
jgi:hypothetical protein